jgi:hypothetical protein
MPGSSFSEGKFPTKKLPPAALKVTQQFEV